MNHLNYDKLADCLSQYPTVRSDGTKPFSTSSEKALPLEELGFQEVRVKCNLSCPDKIRFVVYPDDGDRLAPLDNGISIYINIGPGTSDEKIKATLIEAVRDLKKPEFRQSTLITRNVI